MATPYQPGFFHPEQSLGRGVRVEEAKLLLESDKAVLGSADDLERKGGPAGISGFRNGLASGDYRCIPLQEFSDRHLAGLKSRAD
ncbi:MAG: hypothetical protein ABSE56_04570 [Bryobacteraceae bacterium]